ncbi:MAG: alpha/beta hydrolase [Anaerolineales bacterium]|nr:alpha/beta hydrolase [Anaerolineales bacterium]
MNRLKTFAKWAGIALLVLLLLLMIVPFLIPVTPLENLGSPQSVALPESQFLTIPFEGTDGLDIHFLADEAQENDEPTFVLLHGSVFNSFTWNEVFNFFDERGRVIAYDQIPYGLSEKLVAGDWNGRNPYSADAAIEQLITLLDTLGVEKAILVGNSYGSVLALKTALTYPDRVEALILADSAVYVQESMPAWAMNLPQAQRLGPLFGRMIGGSEAFVRQTYLDPSAIDDERMRLTLIHTEVADWDEAMWSYLQEWGTAPIDLTEQLAAVTQPSLVITGDSDAVVPIADSERLANTLPNAEYAVLAKCGHVPQEECPAQFEDVVTSWLEQHNQ